MSGESSAAGRRNLSETATTGRYWKTGSTAYSRVKPASPRWNFPIRCSGLHGLLAEKEKPVSGLRKSLPRNRRRMWRHSFFERNARRSCAVEYRKQPGGHCKSVHRNVSGVLCQAGGGTALFCSESTVYAFGGVSCDFIKRHGTPWPIACWSRSTFGFPLLKRLRSKAGFRGFKPGFIRPFRAEILLSFISCIKNLLSGFFSGAALS